MILALIGLGLGGGEPRVLAYSVLDDPRVSQRVVQPERPAIEAQQLSFSHLGTEDGLPHQVVRAVLQDHQGFVWFGTQDGLGRYDGYEFETFRHDPEDPTSLSSNSVLALYEDTGGTLWVGTEGGLNRLDRDTGRFTRYGHDPRNPASLSSNVVGSILEDRQGRLWIATWDAGLNRMNRETEQFDRFLPDPDEPSSIGSEIIYDIWQDLEGMLWLATEHGVDRLDPNSGRCTHYGHDPSDPSSLASDRTRTVLQDRTGALWVGTLDGGLDRLDPETGRAEHFRHDVLDSASLSSDAIQSLFEDDAGSLWIGTDRGLDRLEPGTGAFMHYRHQTADQASLSNDTINGLMQDQGGGLWVATAGGANVSYPSRQRFQWYGHNPADPGSIDEGRVNSVLADPAGEVWLGGDHGLQWLDRSGLSFGHLRYQPGDLHGLSGSSITVLLQDREGDLWVGTANHGLYHVPLAELKRAREGTGSARFDHYEADPEDPHTLSQNQVSALYADHQGTLWVGSVLGGVSRFDRNTGTFTTLWLEPEDALNWGNIVWAILEDTSGVLWFGTGKGLYRLDPGVGQVIRYEGDASQPITLLEGKVSALFEDTRRNLWVSADNGLYQFGPDRELAAHYTVKRGLPSDQVCGVVQDPRGYLWVSTSRGIARFDPAMERFRVFGTGDGVQAGDCTGGAIVRNVTGDIYVGGAQGLNRFNPAQIEDNPRPPPVVLTSLTQGGQPMAQPTTLGGLEQITLRWPNNFFEFELAALSFAQPSLNQYAYMLDGFDREWNVTGNSRVGRYTNLPGGTYTLQIRGSNNDGAWSDPGTALRVTVVPPIWQTWWLRGAAMVLLMAAVAAAYGLRLRSVEARSRALEAQVRARTEEIDRRGQALEALYKADMELYRHLELNQVLQAVADITVDNLGADKSAVICWDTARGNPVIQVAQGFSAVTAGQVVAGRQNKVLEHILSTGETAISEDMANDPLVNKAHEGLFEMALAEGIEAMMLLPITINGGTFGVFLVGHTHTHVFDTEEQRLFSALAQRAALAIDNARRFDAEQRRAEQFRVLGEVGSEITSIMPVDETLEQVVRLVRDTFGYYHVGIGLREGDEIVYRVGAGVLWDSPGFVFRPPRLKIGQEGLTGVVASTGRPLLVPDVRRDPRYVLLEGSQTLSELVVPIKVKGQVIGVLDVQSDRVNAFDETDLKVLQVLAHQTGAAIENTQLYETAQQAAVLQERGRLARELHDAVTQTLFSASLLAEVLPATYAQDPEQGRALLKDLRQLSRGALAEMRTLLLELRPAVLAEADLEDLLHQLGDAVTGRAGVAVTLSAEGACELPEDVHLALYRIAQEALNNVVKHARASNVSISLRCARKPGTSEGEDSIERAELEIVDDGIGFDPSRVPSDHLGLRIVGERAKAVGAAVDIASKPGHGTRLRLVWPASTTEEPVGAMDVERTGAHSYG